MECCKSGDYCNADLNLDATNEKTCTTVAWADSYITTLYECIYNEETLSANNSLVAQILFCDLGVSTLIGYDICSYVEALAKYSYGCTCKGLSAVYTYSGTTSSMQSGIELDIEYANETINYLSSLFECDIIWSCDLSSGTITAELIVYYITFDITVDSSTLTSNVTYNTVTIIKYLAGVLSLSSTDISFVSYSGGTSIKIKIVFNDYSTATTYQTELSSGDYSFGSSITLDTSSVSSVKTQGTSSSEGSFIHVNYIYTIIMVMVFWTFLL